MFEYTAHDTVAARVYLDTDLLLVLACIGYLVGIDLTVLERHALGYTLHVGTRQRLVECHLIYLLLLERRVRQLAGHIAVIGEKQQSHTVLVETSYGIYTLRAGVLHKIHHRFVGMRVVHRRHISLGLVQYEIHLLLALNALVVETHVVRRLNLRTEFRHDHAVHSNQTCLYVIVGLTSRAETRLSQKTVQTYLVGHLRRSVLRIALRSVTGTV